MGAHHMVEAPNQGSTALIKWLRAAMPMAVIGMHCNACLRHPLKHCKGKSLGISEVLLRRCLDSGWLQNAFIVCSQKCA